MKVVIVEDDWIVADHLQNTLHSFDIEVMGIADSYDDAMELMAKNPDLFFVDIRLKGVKTGIDLAQELSANNIPFVYLTANNEVSTMKKAVQTAPLTYLSKPYNKVDVLAVVELLNAKKTITLSVKTALGNTMLNALDISYIEAEGSYVNLLCNNKIYRERCNLGEYENIAPFLVKTHRSYIVNLKHVSQYNSSFVFINEKSIPISRSHKDSVIQLLKDGEY